MSLFKNRPAIVSNFQDVFWVNWWSYLDLKIELLEERIVFTRSNFHRQERDSNSGPLAYEDKMLTTTLPKPPFCDTFLPIFLLIS